MKVIGIIENNHITGIQYGLIEVPAVIIERNFYAKNISKTVDIIPQPTTKPHNNKMVAHRKKPAHSAIHYDAADVSITYITPRRYVAAAYTHAPNNQRKAPVDVSRKHKSKQITQFIKNQRNLKYKQQNMSAVDTRSSLPDLFEEIAQDSIVAISKNLNQHTK